MAEGKPVRDRFARWRAGSVTVLMAVLAIPLLVLAILRLLGVDGNRFTASALALTPYAAIIGLLLTLLAFGLRRWWIGGVTLLIVVALGTVLLPRMFSNEHADEYANEQAGVSGRTLRVMSINLHFGQADPQSIVDLVRSNNIEVLSLLEMDQPAVDKLEQAGLFNSLPHRVLHPAGAGEGSGLVSIHPLSEVDLVPVSTFYQPSARAELGGGASVEVTAVHAMPPTTSADRWRSDLIGLPRPTADLPVRVLAGDFNATWDHGEFRRLIDTGYLDAAEQTGKGFAATWPAGIFPPPVTIDHILVDDRVQVIDYQVLKVPDTDHDAVYAEIVVPI